jgi:hypothetical protein
LEIVPIILQELYSLISKDKCDQAIALLDHFHISNDMLKEHLMDLCMNKHMRDLFDKLTPQ